MKEKQYYCDIYVASIVQVNIGQRRDCRVVVEEEVVAKETIVIGNSSNGGDIRDKSDR